jgi:diacylglycerol kinase family enzyme
MAGLLIVNPRAGRAAETGDVVAAARARGLEVHVLDPGEDAAEAARRADAEAVGIAGGDGSLAPAAAVCVERGLPLVCVPLGTRNHFARDLGLDRGDPATALGAFGGRELRIDVGRANGRLFLNNVSFGAYAVLVHHGWRRALDAVRLRHRLTVDGAPLLTRVLLVANNAYAVSGTRARLDEGLLYLYTPGGPLHAAPRVVVEGNAARRAAIDGEPAALTSPVELTIEPRALRVLVPRSPGA